ncbi:hypothetical protein LAZ67_13000448, partial [Cordylochernes scorpioides]
MTEVGANDDFIVVKGKKRRRGSTSPEHAARQPNKPGEQRSSQQRKRPAGPRAVPPQEIKATRVNIADARARQATTNHENYIFVELCPDIPDYSYLKAIGNLVGGPKNITQFNRMNGHYIVGLASKNLASRLVEEGLNIEGTLLKVFPFRKRAERIIVANLPGFVEDATIVQALRKYGNITSIAPIMIKMTIHSKGDTLSAFLSFGIKCSKCGKQGHRRANCPALARQGNGNPRQAASPTDARPPPPPPPQQPRKPAPAPATPASPVQPAKTSTEAQAIPSAHQPAEQMDVTHPAPAAHPTSLAAPRPPEPRISPLDHEMSVEGLTSPPSTPARGKAALEQLLEHLKKSPNISIDWDKLPDLNREEVQKLLTSETTRKRRASTLTPAQFKALNKLHDTIKPLCPDSNSTIRKTLQKTRKETNAFHLGSGQDLCLGYSAVVLAHPVAISGSGLACVFGPGVAVLHQRILWPGHIALATIDVRGEEMTAIAVHLAHEPRERNRQLELLAATAAQEEEGACWIIGDFNIRDRGPSSSSSSDALAALMDLAALVDVATQFDAAHLPTRVAMHGDQVESNRLDRILVPAGVLDRASIYATSHYHLSDHRLVLLQVGPPTTAVSSPTQPRLAAMLRSGLALEHLAGYIRELEEDTAHDDDDGTFWDRWTSIKVGLLAEPRSLHDPRHAASDSYVYRARRYIAAQLEASSIRADYPSLPDLARAIRLRRPVSVIRDEEDNVIEGPELRRRAFATFQPRFARPTSDPAAGAAFIASSAPTTTTRELSEEDPLLRPDISPSEIAHAIEHLPRGKAPGWDGLPCELLVAFNEDFFAEALARVFAASRLRGALPPSTRRSSICLVPKARGGRGLDGYRPVALPSADYRVLAAILHRRLKPHLRTLVPECQTYAVPGRSPSWNIAKVTDAVEEATAMGSPLAVMGIDLESAFDSLDRGFLESLMTSLRLPPAFMGWINILYAGADATIRAGGFHTTAFPLLNGLRQGCAVSAALFSIATGPLLRRLELTLGVGNVIAYADDIVLLFHRDGDFERVATVFEEYKQASGVGVNLRKSAGLWCGAWRNRGDSPLGASWSTTSIRVLGLDIAPRSTVAHREQHLLALLKNACRKWTPFTRGLSLVGRARAANTLVGSVIQHHLHGYLPSPPTIAKLQARLARFVWGQDHTAWLPADVMARPVAIGGLGLLDLATQLQLACLKGVQVALRGGRNAFSWLVESGEAWIHPPPDGTCLQPRRLRLLKLWEEASNILGLNHRAVPTAQLLDLNIIGGCRFLRPPDLLAPARWRGARVRDLLAEGHLTARPTRSALADAAALGAFCRRLTSENAVGFGAESAPSSSSLAAAVVLRGTATPFLNGLTTRSARRALDRPRLAATPISRFISRWSPTIGPLPSRIDWASLRRCAYSGHEADAALKLALHALPHPAHPASVGPSCPACGSIDRSLGHRYWCCRSIRPLIREAFNIIGRPPDLQAWIFGGSGLEDDALSILASAKLRIYRYFVQVGLGEAVEDPLIAWSRTLQRRATSLVRAESPSKAAQEPVRRSTQALTCAELSAKDLQRKISNNQSASQNYANPPTGVKDANLAAARVDVTTGSAAATSSNGAACVLGNWADCTEDQGPGEDDDFTVIKNKKRRRDSPGSPAAAAPSSGTRGAGATRRPRSSTGWAPRAEEVRTTRAHIAEARARQASSTEDHCVFVERSPELEPYHYMRAIDRMFGSTRDVFQVTKMNGHFLVGMASRGMAERLVNEGLEVEGTLHRAFPFRKRAERITVGNLPFFVGDAAVISALSPFGRVTSIAPKLMKAGPYVYNDGRREAFFILREGMTIERLPTRLDIPIKGEAWPAYLSSGIRCSRCQGHRRANCPLLAGRTTEPGPATPTSPTSVPPATAPKLPQQPSAKPPPPASPSPAMEVSDVPPASRAALLPPAALRSSPPAPLASPAEETPLPPPPVTPASPLRAPGGPVSPQSAKSQPSAQDIEMTTIEESSASSTASSRKSTREDLVTLIRKSPAVSFAETDALGLGREEILDLLSSKTRAQRQGPLLTPPQNEALAGMIKRLLGLKPGSNTSVYKVLRQVKSVLRTGPAAVPPTPTLTAPRPAKPTPPVPQRKESAPTRAASLLAMPIKTDEDRKRWLRDTFKELDHRNILRPILEWIDEDPIINSVLCYEDAWNHFHNIPRDQRRILSGFLDTVIERARGGDQTTLDGLFKFKAALCNVSLNMSNSTSPESPGSAGQKPGRPSILTPTGSENSAKNEFHGEIYGEKSNSREYVNPPADGGNVNLAAARVDVTSGIAAASSSNGAALTIRNWADCDEVMNPGTDDDFTVVKNKKRRRESSNSPTAATPSSNNGGARSGRRVQSSARSVPRAQEIPTTRAHIAEARARQTSSAEEHCVYLEHGPELQPFHYLRALDRLLGGTAGVVQVSKVNGHQLLGLANRGLAERLINNGLEVEGTLLRAFPFRKRAERITVGNLPFFVEDSAIIKALGPYGRITSIAPKMMKAGPYTYTYTDGRREAFIVLHEGVTTERLPTRLNITIKGEAWPAYLSSGIKCSRCHGQGHRRANCPLLAGRVNTTRSAPPASPAGLPPTTTTAPPQRPTPQHSAPAPPLEISGASPAPRAAIHPAGAPRPSPTAPSASPTEETPPAPPTVTPDSSSQAPRDPASQEILGPANIAQDIDMTAVEESIPPSASSNKKCTRIDLAAFIKRSPSVSFAGTDALGLGREEVLDLLSSRTKAHKRGRHLTPPQSNALAGLVNQILDLRPGGDSNSTIYKVLRQVLSELRTGTAAVPPAPTLPAPRPAEPAPPAPQKRESTPAMATPPPPPSAQMEVDPIDKRCKELQLLTFELMKEFNPKPMPQLISFELDLVEAVLYPEDRKGFLGRFSPGDKKVLAQILDKLSTRDLDSLTLRGLSELRAALPPKRAAHEPERLSSKSHTSAELSAKIAFQKNSSEENQEKTKHANPPAGDVHVNPAAARDVTAPPTAASSSATTASPASLNWADSEMVDVDENEGFTVVKNKKRRRTSTTPERAAKQPSRPAEKPSSQQLRRPTGPRTVPPREIKATRANIADAKARQAATNHEHYIFVERCPEIPDYTYLKAMSRLVGGPDKITHFGKMNDHFLVGLTTKDLARLLVESDLEIGGTTLRVFPYRKRAERIVVAGLPGFVDDFTIVNALGQYGRVTSIAPILVKLGEFAFNDGRREAFILLHEGVRLETLPARLTIQSKGDTLSAYLSFGIRCSKCGRHGHRRASCPSLARRNFDAPKRVDSPAQIQASSPSPTVPQRTGPPSPVPSPPAPLAPSEEAPNNAPVTPAAAAPGAPALHPARPLLPPGEAPSSTCSASDPPTTPALPPPVPAEPMEVAQLKEEGTGSTQEGKNKIRKELDACLRPAPSTIFDKTNQAGLEKEREARLQRLHLQTPSPGPAPAPSRDFIIGFTIASINARGLAIRNKSLSLCHLLRQHRVDIALVQETNTHHLDGAQDLCLGYDAITAPPDAISGSGLACIYAPGVTVSRHRILWPGHIVLATFNVHGQEMTVINVHLSHDQRERIEQLRVIEAAVEEEEEAWVLGDFNIRDDRNRDSISMAALGALCESAALLDAAPEFDAAHLPTRVAAHGDLIESSRLDRILAPARFLEVSTSYAIAPFHLSDHRMVLLRVGPPAAPSQPRVAATLRSGLAQEHMNNYLVDIAEEISLLDAPQLWDRWTLIKAGILAEARSLHDPRHHDRDDGYIGRAQRYIRVQGPTCQLWCRSARRTPSPEGPLLEHRTGHRRSRGGYCPRHAAGRGFRGSAVRLRLPGPRVSNIPPGVPPAPPTGLRGMDSSTLRRGGRHNKGRGLPDRRLQTTQRRETGLRSERGALQHRDGTAAASPGDDPRRGQRHRLRRRHRPPVPSRRRIRAGGDRPRGLQAGL